MGDCREVARPAECSRVNDDVVSVLIAVVCSDPDGELGVAVD